MEDKFSYKNFLSKGLGSVNAEALSGELESSINARLHEVIYNEINKIVYELNQTGHNLTHYYEPSPGDISYRDQEGEKDCKLRLGVDTIVSVGFGDTEG